MCICYGSLTMVMIMIMVGMRIVCVIYFALIQIELPYARS